MTPLKVLVDLAASRRLTRLVTKDEITRPMREHQFFHKHEKLSYLVHCPFCVSVYSGLLIAGSSILFSKDSKIVQAVIYGLALSEFQSTLVELEEQRDALAQDYGNPL